MARSLPDYALYVYTDKPSRARPVVIGLSDPEHLVVAGTRLAGAAPLWQLAQAILEPPPRPEYDPRGLLRATRVKVLIGGEAPVVFDCASGPESLGRVAGLARLILAGTLNNLYEEEGTAAAVLTFTVGEQEQEVWVFENTSCGEGSVAVVRPAAGLYSGRYRREGLAELVRVLTTR